MDLFDASKWLALAAHYPDLIALIVGTMVGFVFTMMIDFYFLPVYTDAARQRWQKGITFLICWASSTAASVGLWTFLDPPDPWGMRIVVSLIVSVLSFFAYPYLAQIAAVVLKKCGVDLSSAWSK